MILLFAQLFRRRSKSPELSFSPFSLSIQAQPESYAVIICLVAEKSEKRLRSPCWQHVAICLYSNLSNNAYLKIALKIVINKIKLKNISGLFTASN